jgi:hypothetical protein
MSVGFGEDTIYEACAKRAAVPQLSSPSRYVCSVTCMRLPVDRLSCDILQTSVGMESDGV